MATAKKAAKKATPRKRAAKKVVSKSVQRRTAIQRAATGAKSKMPEYKGARVAKILEDGRETPTHYHVQLEDGRTMHVPKSIFN